MSSIVNNNHRVTNVVFAGLGGQGVLKASDILADAAFLAGLDVKKSEIHGMSQRGGSVTSDVRFGSEVFSPMVPPGEADYLVVLTADQVDAHRHLLRAGGRLIEPSQVDPAVLPHPRSLNVLMLGILSCQLEIPESVWQEALARNLPPKLHDVNRRAFAAGKALKTGD